MRILVLLFFMGLISQKSFSQESVSVSFDDSMRFRISMKKIWPYENDGVNYLFNQKYITVDLGTVNDGDNNEVNFYFTNHSDTALVFSNVGWGEPNFAPNYSKEPTLKGQTSKITYKRHERKAAGRFDKTAHIQSDLTKCWISFRGYTPV